MTSSINTSIIRPGLLVSLKTTVRGGVSYEKTEIEAEHSIGETATAAKWQTSRVIADAAEHDAATKTRGKARSLIQSACCPSTFGLLCPSGRERILSEAIEEARALADAHNINAKHSRVEVYVITGRVSDNDTEAARAIGSEVRELLAAMESGVKAANPELIREAANKARALSGMLSEDAQRKVSAAISEVRAAAREIVRRVEKSGELAASVVDEIALTRVNAARFAVLDLSDPSTPLELAEEAPARAIDLFAAPDFDDGPLVSAPSFELMQ